MPGSKNEAVTTPVDSRLADIEARVQSLEAIAGDLAAIQRDIAAAKANGGVIPCPITNLPTDEVPSDSPAAASV